MIVAEFLLKIRYRTVFALLTVVLIALSACEANQFRFIPSVSEPFSATVEGQIDRTQITALIWYDPTEHVTKEIYRKMTVTFLAPESLEGLAISLFSDGKVSAELGKQRFEGGLLRQAVAPFLTLIPSSPYSTIQKEEDGSVTLTVREGEDTDLSYLYDKEGVLERIEGTKDGRNILFFVTMKDK